MKNGAWDCVFIADRKTFTAQTNQITHNLVRKRFAESCVPDWVVEGNLELSKLSEHKGTDDKNNTQQIFHKT